ncbi:MAG TPA: hypothetical protein P5092_13350 [Ruminococcus sp.]|nr:hypothetical protein [Ruminococcus sp.]
MSTAKINREQMEDYLGRFGVSYHSPIYITMTDLSGFLASNKNVRWGYAALSDDNSTLFVVVMSLLSVVAENTVTFHTISRSDVQSMHFSRILLSKAYNTDIKFIEDGKKKRFKIIIGANAKKELEDQEINSQNMLDILRTW